MPRLCISLFAIWCTVFCSVAVAGGYNNFYCEKTFKSVGVGASMDTVRNACGAPSSSNTRNVQVSTPVESTQWIYTLGLLSIKGVAVNLPSITLTFRDHQVVQIEKSGLPVSNGGYCSMNGLINIGDPDTKVMALCGRPNFISTLQQAQTTIKQIVDWTYNFGIYKPQIIFSFENGILTDINSGKLGSI